ncbi:TetR/AcrR family transcriptional regulator [Nocardioides campestrisoli]|uniref:TetR/AcrR family transcriptional regulator n=1 Tax=Nocardioides campestrisoli TaxID=2736757 RepID=UPI0015E77245|nr:TetR/AcrR family transcriptional regulator [Nocardioides campestrisoli]
MGRRREHDLDAVLDHARSLWAEGGAGAVTIRALSAASGVSNGAIYHAFGSRDGLMATVWTREAGRLLDLQDTLVQSARDAAPDPEAAAVAAVVAAATAPATYAVEHPDGARLLLSVTDDRLLDGDLAPEQRDHLLSLRTSLGSRIAGLSTQLWGRDDRAAQAVVRACVVQLPAALLHPRALLDAATARSLLERAVRGVLAGPPPPPA